MSKEELLKTAKPILFNSEMVQAILSGRKTVTRRVVKPRSRNACGFYVCYRKSDGAFTGVYDYDENEKMFENPQSPMYKKGDILYVRETWNYGYWESSDVYLSNEKWFEPVGKRDCDYLKGICGYIYRADFTLQDESDYGYEHKNSVYKMDWHPSIHMPKEAARIFLRVTDVRVERLQDITEEQAINEGTQGIIFVRNRANLTQKEVFELLWNSTIKESNLGMYGYNSNPWVWVIEFEKLKIGADTE